ncbi:MAG: hypothetical protein ACYCPS_04810 [Candidatus Saccharimonadales bacterium]
MLVAVESDAATERAMQAVEEACVATASWLTHLPAWPDHPTNASGSVSAHFGPTILSEHDCVMQFARHLNEAGMPWEDIHLEFSPAQWMFDKVDGSDVRPKRIDLAVVSRERLLGASFPTPIGGFRFDAVIEFALASNYWQFGVGSKETITEKIVSDIIKAKEYLASGLAAYGYVVVFEETDHGFPAGWDEPALAANGVRTRVLRRWR